MHRNLRNDVADFPNMSDVTLWRIVRRMNFKYQVYNGKPILMESPEIVRKRREFLNQIKKYRDAGYKIFYTDETWCGANHTKKFGWVEDTSSEENVNSFDFYRSRVQHVASLRGGFLVPSGAGKRVIITHIGSEDGFLEEGMDCFVGKKDGDYHNEMNSEYHTEWFTKILTLLPAKSVIVIDLAPYHTTLDPEKRNSTKAWAKAATIQ